MLDHTREPRPARFSWATWSTIGLVSGFAILVGATAILIRHDDVRAISAWKAQLSNTVAYRSWMLAESIQESEDDARVLAESPASSQLLVIEGQPPESSPRRAAASTEISSLFSAYHSVYEYDPVCLADAHGRVRAQAAGSEVLKLLLEGPEIETILRAGALSQTTKVDLLQTPLRQPFLVFTAPVRDASPLKPPLGTVALLDQLNKDLFPLLLGEGAPTSTGETLLLSLKNGRATYISPLRQHPPAATDLLESHDTLAKAALWSSENATIFGEFFDYRNTRVLAAIRKLPSLDCAVICKIDRHEAFSGFRTTASLEVITALAVLTIYLASILGYQRDVARRRESESLIRQLNLALEQRVGDRTAQLEAANKELEAFAYSVSHDLRAPIRHLSAFSESLRKRSYERLDERERHYLDKISESSVQMGKLIDDLLNFSRLGRAGVSKSRFALEPLVQEVRKGFEAEITGRSIEWQIARLPEVYADPALLRQVLINLMSNALKYTRGREQARIEIGSTKGKAESVIFVRDNGIGFEMQYVDRLFKVFQRLHSEEFEGTGIGLANVRRIVERHGGRVWAEGAPERGATFYFSIPAREGIADE